ncbi:hypothetical protein [Nesterenkonia cremea]|uniref:Uncharacterized protein n=1 Tax=Nesterenkonia cremea TaxID=1882340 RepID=A0A917ENM1_9MICC|nr:hypothetical protein [Nesterenkonia cremea]GGE64988.1 hypothetical protein GCM10011401_10160 [Nesterenkonia cremea]
MPRQALYPYARLAPDDVRWPRWGLSVDGKVVSFEELDTEMDLQSEISFSLAVLVDRGSLERAGYVPEEVTAVAEMLSPDTNLRRVRKMPLSFDAYGHLGAQLTVTAESSELGQELLLDACLLASGRDSDFGIPLRLQERRRQKLTLGDRARFPTVAYSFTESRFPAAPWYLEVDAMEPEAPMNVHAKLHLNTDFEVVEALLEGTAPDHVMAAMRKDVARALIQEARTLADEITRSGTLERFVEQHPDSIIAAADQTARGCMGNDLKQALKLMEENPREFELRLSSGVGYWKGAL